MITRSQIRRQLRRGGIASLPRQGYFVGDIVGGIGDVLGGAAKKAKEIVKSDAGKAALALAGLYATRNMGPIGEAGGWKKFLLGAPGVGGPAHGAREGLLGKWGLTKGFGGGITGLGMGAAAGVGTAALMAGAPKPPKDQLDLMRQRGEDIEPYLRDWYKKYYTANWQEGWTQEGEDEFVRVNTSEYNKGGRVGYARGPEEPFLLDEDIPELGEDINLQELIKEEGIPIGEQVKGPLLPELEEEDIMEFMQDQGIQTKDLEAGAADIKVTGDVTPDIEKFIKEKWIERGGEWGDLIPKWFRDEIIKYYNLRASAPHPDENWMGLWEDLRGKGEVPESIRNLQEFKNWFHKQDFDIDMSQVDTGIMQASKGGRAGMQKGGRGLLSLSHLPWLRLLEEDEEEYKKGGRVGLQGGASVDPRMKQSLRENTALNDARRAVNQALSGTGGEGAIDRLYSRFGIANPAMYSPGTNPRSGQTYHSISDRAALERELSGKILGGGYKGTAEYERQQQAASDRAWKAYQAKQEAEGKRMQAEIEAAYGKGEDYGFEAELLGGMGTGPFYDYLVTGDPAGVHHTGGEYINPYNVYYRNQLARQKEAGMPLMQYGQVEASSPLMMKQQPGATPRSPYVSYADALSSLKQRYQGANLPFTVSGYGAPKESTWAEYERQWGNKGGRIGLKQGTPKWTEEFRKLGLEGGSTKEFRKLFKKMKKKSKSKAVKITKAQGGRINQLYGTGPVGLPGIPRMAADGLEYDMRGGGFQNLGAKEGRDDVKANLAKNEFVMTADAVRGAGGGDIEVGAQRMYDTMKKLERKIA